MNLKVREEGCFYISDIIDPLNFEICGLKSIVLRLNGGNFSELYYFHLKNEDNTIYLSIVMKIK